LLYRHIKIKIYVSIILSAVLYGFETWSLTLREEHRPRVFGNRVLRRVFGPRWDGVTSEWKRLHNKELYDMYSPNVIRVNKSRRIRWTGHVALWRRGEVYREFWWGNLRERDLL
jgi:hypothetical protein